MTDIKPSKIRLLAITITAAAIVLTTTFAMAANPTNNAWSKLDSNTADFIKERLNHELCSFTTDGSGRIQATTADKSLSLKADSETIRFDSGDNWFGLKLKSVGRSGNMKNVGSPIVSSKSNELCMVYKKQSLTQWYKNGEQSIEHSLVLNKRPAGTGKLNISFAATGNLTPEQNGKDIIFTGTKNINYSGIKAWDRTGKRLPCLLVADSGNISWIIDDAKAQYPITVDPTVSVATALIPTEEVEDNDYYGSSVAVSDDTILIGAMRAGEVYIFSKNADNNWVQTQKLSGEISFGYSCAISGNVAVIGAYTENKVYVYSKNTDGEWIADTDYGTNGIIEAPEDGNFGYSVSISGSTIVVGASGYKYGDKNSVGTAYVYEAMKPEPFQLKYYQYSSDAKVNSQFGISVSIYENTIVIGADGMLNRQDSAYIFTRETSDENGWTLLKELKENDTSYFGHSVAISGDIIVIGSCGPTNDNYTKTVGSAYIYSKDKASEDNKGWGLVQKLTPQETDGNEDTAALHFGQSVSISGDKIAIGAPGQLIINDSPGAAYIFAKGTNTNGAEWHIVKRLAPSTDSPVNHKLGYSVNIFQNHVAIGQPAPKESPSSKGSVFFYKITDDSTPGGDSDGDSDGDSGADSGGNSGGDSGGDSGGSETTIPDKIVVPTKDQPSGTSVTIDEIEIKVRTADELRSQYQNVGMDSMLGSQIYDFSATVTANQLAYFAFNSTSLGERRAGEVKLYKLFTDKNSLQYTYSPDKTPAEEGCFWITDEGNSGQYIDPNTILVGGRSYTLNFSILDNGEYDANSTAGAITDPVAPGLGPSEETGCVFNPDADFSFEWLLLGISIVLLLFRSRFEKEN